MYITVSNDVIADNRDALMLLADFGQLVARPQPPVLPPDCPRDTFEQLCREPAMIEEVATVLTRHFPDRSTAMAAVRAQYEYNRMADLLEGSAQKDRFWQQLLWGCPGNAEEVDYSPGEKRLSFNTRFFHPFPVIVALSRQFPDELFDVSFAEESLGYHAGGYTIRNGQYRHFDVPPDLSDAAFRHGFYHWGWRDRYIRDDEGYLFVGPFKSPALSEWWKQNKAS